MGLKERGSKRKQLAKTLLGIFLAIFIFGFILNFVDVNQNQPIIGLAFLNFESDIIQPWQEGTLNLIVARYLFFILGIILIYSLLGFFGEINPFIRFIAGFILAFLFTGYIVPEDLLAVMTTYSAAGIALIAIIPPLLLMVFSASILTQRKMGVGSAILQRFLWLFYFIFMIYSTFRFWGTSQGGVDISNPVLLILLVVTFIAFAAFIWNNFYLKFITNTIVSAYSNVRAAMATRKRERIMKQAERNAEQASEDMDDIFGNN